MRTFVMIKKKTDNIIEENYIVCRKKTKRKMFLNVLALYLKKKKEGNAHSALQTSRKLAW